jgi:SAM-dependent methyltransferase
VSHAGTRFDQCTGCGYAVLSTPPRRDDYWSDSDDVASESAEWRDISRAYFRAALRTLETVTDRGRLLDIGGGPGYFAEAALRGGWDAYTFDVSPKASAAAAERVGADRVLLQLDEGVHASFDAVSMFCVVAHTPDPGGVVRQAAGVLRDGGVLLITTPNFRFQRRYAALRALAGRGIDFGAEDHVRHFTFEALRALLVRNGFADIRLRYFGVREACFLTGTRNPFLVGLKRSWNRIASTLSRFGFPNYASELHVVAQLNQRPADHPSF